MTGTGKAGVKKTVIDDIIKLNRQEAKSFGLARQQTSGISSSTVLGSSGVKGGSDGNNNGDLTLGLRTSGGTMIGPLAFYFQSATVTKGTIDVGIDASYTSRILVIGEGAAADDLEVILNASFAGQILYMQPIQEITIQDFTKTATAWATSTAYAVGDVVLSSSQRYTCYTAHTSSATTQPGTGATWDTVWYRNNIRVTGADDLVVAVDEIIQLMFDSTDSVWTVVSGGGGSGGGGSALLASNNIWTGTNEFNGSFTSVAGTFSATGASTTIGDAGTDIFNLVAKMGTDINMSTYDITDVDRVKFSTTAGSGSALTSTDTGIEALYNAGVPYGMLIQFPSASSAIMQIKRGVTDMINISSLGILFGDELLMGGFKISNVLNPTSAQDAATKDYVDNASTTGANTALSNLAASTAINSDLLGGTTGVINLGSTTKRFNELHILAVHFDTIGGTYIKNVGTDIEMRCANTRDIIFSESNALGVSNPFMTLSGLGNNVQMDREVYMNSNKIVSLGTPTASADAATKAYVDSVVVAGANTALSNLVSASVSINADMIPDISGARNLGGSTKYWGSAFISNRMYFNSGINKYIDGIAANDLELRVPSGGQIIFSENGTDFYTMDGGSNVNLFSRDIHLTAAEAIRADSATEIGYFVTNTTAAVGSQGSVQIPTANQGVTTAAAADAVFGSEIGCCGMFTISGGQALAVKITSTTWQILQLGVSGSTATPYII